ncbi:MAG: hypothetical protein HRT45_17285 [Bdellovibrionales bacterium]|nr:hypothetical protein [Bdellovibrionales bacterium]
MLQSEHFDLIYPERLKTTAIEYLYQAERSHYDLKPLFKEMPSKTYIIMMDNTDSANGYANFIPYPHIVVFPVLPTELSSIGYYGNWAYELIVHEYTHILSFYPSHSFYTPLKWLFGSVVRPNAILPRWFLEGVAVQVESRYSSHGRLRAPGTSSALRALVREDRLTSYGLDQINETSVPWYPFGRRPYLFGSLLWQSVINEAGLNTVEGLHQMYSRRLPFLLDTPVEELAGKGYSKLLAKIYSQVEELSKRQMAMVKSASSMPTRVLIDKEQEVQVYPKVSPDGKHLAYVASEPFNGSSIQLRSKTSKKRSSFRTAKSRFIQTATGTQRLCWSQDSSRFIFEQTLPADQWASKSDLFEYKLGKKEIVRLTKAARAREGCYSPDGSEVVFVEIDAANTSLKILNKKSKKMRTLFQPPDFERVSSPLYLSDDTFLFVWKNSSGTTKLYKIKEGQQPERLLADFDDVLQPTLTRKGLLFNSSRTGIPNIYFAKPPFTSAKPVTNSETGMWSADLDPETNELLATESSAYGPKLLVVKPKYRRPPQLKSVVPGTLAPREASQFFADKSKVKIKVDDEEFEIDMKSNTFKVRDTSFWGLEYLRPRYWIPFIFPVEGGVIFQGSVVSQDPLAINTIFLDGSYDTVTTGTSYSVSYVNRSTPVDISTSYSEFQDYQPAIDVTYTNRFASTGLGFRLPWASVRWRGSLGGRFREAFQPLNDGDTRVLRGVGPSIGISFSPGRTAENVTQQFPGQTAFSLFHTQFLEGGDNYNFGQTRFSLGHAWTSFLPNRHSLVFQAKGSYAPDMILGGTDDQVLALGDRTLAGNFLVTIINSSFIMRGYPSAAFVGRQLYNTTLEYRFPMLDIFKGKSYFPLFFRNLNASWFIDGISVDGAYFDPTRGFQLSKVEETYWSTGLEFHLNTTLAYHLPLSTTLGLYYGFSEEAGGGFIPFITFGYSGHGGVGGVQNPTTSLQ